MPATKGQKYNKKDDMRLGYYLGQKDMLAYVLAETKDKVKLPILAEEYKLSFKEAHFSHKWHTSQ